MDMALSSLEGLQDKFEEEIIRDTIQKIQQLTLTRENGRELSKK